MRTWDNAYTATSRQNRQEIEQRIALVTAMHTAFHPLENCPHCHQDRTHKGWCVICGYVWPGLRVPTEAEQDFIDHKSVTKTYGTVKCRCGAVVVRMAPNQFRCPNCKRQRRSYTKPKEGVCTQG